MSEGYAARHVALVDDAAAELRGALLPTEHELWDGQRRRLTILLDPARIKRGLAGHRQAGYPLRPGTSFRLVVGGGFPDARDSRCQTPGRSGGIRSAVRSVAIVEPGRWALTVPPAISVPVSRWRSGLRAAPRPCAARPLPPGGRSRRPASRRNPAGGPGRTIMAADAMAAMGGRISSARGGPGPGGSGRQLGQPGIRPGPDQAAGRARGVPAGHGHVPPTLNDSRCSAASAMAEPQVNVHVRYAARRPARPADAGADRDPCRPCWRHRPWHRHRRPPASHQHGPWPRHPPASHQHPARHHRGHSRQENTSFRQPRERKISVRFGSTLAG